MEQENVLVVPELQAVVEELKKRVDQLEAEHVQHGLRQSQE